MNEWMIISTLILHLVNNKQLTDQQITRLVSVNRVNRDKIQNVIVILRELTMINQQQWNGHEYYEYKRPDETKLKIKDD